MLDIIMSFIDASITYLKENSLGYKVRDTSPVKRIFSLLKNYNSVNYNKSFNCLSGLQCAGGPFAS